MAGKEGGGRRGAAMFCLSLTHRGENDSHQGATVLPTLSHLVQRHGGDKGDGLNASQSAERRFKSRDLGMTRGLFFSICQIDAEDSNSPESCRFCSL